MDRAELGTTLYNLINSYSDFTNAGFSLEHTIPDLSHLNSLEVKESPPQPQQVESPPQPTPQLKPIKRRIEDNSTVRNKRRSIINLAQEVLKCTACPLHQGCSTRVPGMGEVTGSLLVITYPPSAEEEAAGRPLVGRFGEFFKKWLSAIGLSEEDIFITSILKCAPKGRRLDRNHFEQCRGFLERQIELVSPKAILTLGQLTFSSFLREFNDLNLNHGQSFKHGKIPFIPTYHPFDVMKNQALKKAVWEDLKKLQALLAGS